MINILNAHTLNFSSFFLFFYNAKRQKTNVNNRETIENSFYPISLNSVTDEWNSDRFQIESLLWLNCSVPDVLVMG